MRIKFKPWAREELETSPFYIENPEEYKNRWKEAFEKEQKLHLELGCGKGKFISKLSNKLYSNRFSRCNARNDKKKYWSWIWNKAIY